VVSAAFEGKRLLERHRLVNAALANEMKKLHALSIRKALTPAEWNHLQIKPQQPPLASEHNSIHIQM
jgi:acid stress-induced BolA-like protein IbaG/YrbA